MRHRRRVKHFDRKSGPRKALLRGLVVSLVEHGRITTTVDRAKELRRHVERAITLGKKQDLASRRLLLSRLPNSETVSTIFSNLVPRFKDRPGGYTRIIKIGRRPGDTAEMAFIEFVDYDWKKADKASPAPTKKAAKGEGADKKATAKTQTEGFNLKAQAARFTAAKRKSVKKMQKRSRQQSRGG